MGKFDGILLCTDLDDTLLTDDKKVSEENKKAIEYFKKEGGLFTFATGRVVPGARMMLKFISPNAPMICFNGGAIYDFNHDKLLWSVTLNKKSIEVVEFVDRFFPSAGIEICTESKVCVAKTNRIVQEHLAFETLPEEYIGYRDITDDWKKVLFMVEADEIPKLRELIQTSQFADKYTFIQSSPCYYELLPKGSDKGAGLIKLTELLRIDRNMTVGMGDNENDLNLVIQAGVGIAVANAVQAVREAADYITVDNNSSAISAVIHALNDGQIKLPSSAD